MNLNRVVEVILSTNEDCVAVYDTQEQMFLYLPDRCCNDAELEALAEELEREPQRYRWVPTKKEVQEYSIIKRFVETITEDWIHRELVRAIQGPGAFRRFKQVIRYYGLEQAWYAFRDNAFRDVAIAWCQRQGIAYDE